MKSFNRHEFEEAMVGLDEEARARAFLMLCTKLGHNLSITGPNGWPTSLDEIPGHFVVAIAEDIAQKFKNEDRFDNATEVQ
jgi:hypothetical protein